MREYKIAGKAVGESTKEELQDFYEKQVANLEAAVTPFSSVPDVLHSSVGVHYGSKTFKDSVKAVRLLYACTATDTLCLHCCDDECVHRRLQVFPQAFAADSTVLSVQQVAWLHAEVHAPHSPSRCKLPRNLCGGGMHADLEQAEGCVRPPSRGRWCCNPHTAVGQQNHCRDEHRL